MVLKNLFVLLIVVSYSCKSDNPTEEINKKIDTEQRKLQLQVILNQVDTNIYPKPILYSFKKLYVKGLIIEDYTLNEFNQWISKPGNLEALYYKAKEENMLKEGVTFESYMRFMTSRNRTNSYTYDSQRKSLNQANQSAFNGRGRNRLDDLKISIQSSGTHEIFNLYDDDYKYEYRFGEVGERNYNYDVEGYDESGYYVYGNITIYHNNEGQGYLYDEDGDQFSIECEWVDYGKMEAEDDYGNNYYLRAK